LQSGKKLIKKIIVILWIKMAHLLKTVIVFSADGLILIKEENNIFEDNLELKKIL
jgi:hypothetical protein